MLFWGEGGVGILLFRIAHTLEIFIAELSPASLPAGFEVVITISIVHVRSELIGKAPARQQSLAGGSH